MSKDKQPEIRFPGFTEDWEERKLDEIFGKIRNAFVGTATPYYVDEGHFYLESNNVKDGRINRNTEVFINDEFYEKQKDKWLHTNDIVMVQSGHVGHTAVIPEDLDKTAAHALIMFSNYKTKTSPFFLNYQFQTLTAKRKLENITTGNTIKHILASEMKKFEVTIPEHVEQQKIGSFFKTFDDTIALHQRKLDLLKETKKGFLQKMFPKNGAKVPEIRFPGFTEAWEERKLGSIYDFSKGKGLPLNSFTYSKDDPAIAYGHLYTKYSEVISEVYLSSDDDGVLSKDNDLLFPGSSTVPNGTAQANAIMLNNVKLGGDIIIARPKQDTRVLSIFMSYQINSQRQKLFPITVGTTITHMYGKDLSKVKFFITNYSEQQKIGAFFKQLDDTIALHQRKLDLLKETKKGFLQKMFV
ncbi:restriction endonuclease subunit S [Enterococcus faecium]|uniref:restriction endonuclease subunit S n=1 Tax=Enterococcus faecium TaxID=1352 RepID=UPI001E62F22A|nr:restriction endonuclease subunit S [Enterococcus faecium]MCD4990106.1 restriction endonuclease subunit S [Enterococcus faecium]